MLPSFLFNVPSFQWTSTGILSKRIALSAQKNQKNTLKLMFSRQNASFSPLNTDNVTIVITNVRTKVHQRLEIEIEIEIDKTYVLFKHWTKGEINNDYQN